MIACYRITVPNWQPTRLNEVRGRHWSLGHRAKLIAIGLLAAYGRYASPALRKRSVRLIITLGPRQRGADPDAYWKILLDALVSLRLLVDDSDRWVRLEPVEYIRGKERATTIELTDLEDI